MRVFLIILALFLQIGLAKEGNFTWQNLEKIEQLCLDELEKESFNAVKVKDRCLEAAMNFENKKDFNRASWYYLLGGEYKRDLSFLKDKINKNFAKANIAHAFVLSGDFEKAKKLYSSFLANEEPHWANSAMQKDYETLQKIYPKKDKNLQKGLEIWEKLFKPYYEYKKLYSKYTEAKKNQNYQKAAVYLKEAIEILKKLQKQNFAICEDYFDLGIAYFGSSNYKEALKYFKKVQTSYEKREGKLVLKKLAELYGWIGNSYYHLKKYKKAIVFYKKEIRIGKGLKSYTQIDYADNLFDLLVVYYHDKEYKKALKSALEAANIYKKNRLYLLLSNIYSWIGDIYLNHYKKIGYGEPEKIKYSIKKAAFYFKKQKHFLTKALLEKDSKEDYYSSSLFNLSLAYEKTFKYKKAIGYAKELERIYQENNQSKSLSNLYSHIIEDYKMLSLYKSAYNYLDKKIKLDKTIYKEESFEVAKDYYDLAFILVNLKQYKKGNLYCHKALNLLDKISKGYEPNLTYITAYNWWNKTCKFVKKYLIAYRYEMKAKKYLLHKRYKQAIKYYLFAYYTNTNNSFYRDYNKRVLKNYTDLAKVYLLMKNYKKALFYYKKAFHISYNSFIDNPQPWKIVRNIGNKIVFIYKRLGNYKKACLYLELISKYQAKSLKEIN